MAAIFARWRRRLVGSLLDVALLRLQASLLSDATIIANLTAGRFFIDLFALPAGMRDFGQILAPAGMPAEA
jgi:hypothetical protein